jgi:hypothetical protein
LLPAGNPPIFSCGSESAAIKERLLYEKKASVRAGTPEDQH